MLPKKKKKKDGLGGYLLEKVLEGEPLILLSVVSMLHST